MSTDLQLYIQNNVNNFEMIKITSCWEIYHLVSILFFEPGPGSGKGIAVAYTDHRTFVVLIAMLRVLIGRNVRKRYSMMRNNDNDEIKYS